MLALKNSGYSYKFRKEVLDSTMKAYKKIIEDDKNGIKPLYRSRDWNLEERQKQKSKKKFNWWNSERSKSITKVFCLSHPPQGGF